METSTAADTEPKNSKSPEEIALEKQANVARIKYEIAQAEFNAAKAQKDKNALSTVETEQQRAEAEKTIAIANKEAIQAKRESVKGPDITPLSGKITSEGNFIESRVLAQKTLMLVLQEMVKKMDESIPVSHGSPPEPQDSPVNLVFYKEGDAPALESYAALLQGINGMAMAYKKGIDLFLQKKNSSGGTEAAGLIAPDPLLIGYAATGLLKTAADIVSLFRLTTDFKNFDITHTDMELAAALGAAIKIENKNWKLFIPSLFPINTLALNDTPSDFIQKLNELQGQAQFAETQIAETEQKIAALKAEMEKEADESRKTYFRKHIENYTPVLTTLKYLNTSFQQLQGFLSTSDGVTKMSTQALILKAERLLVKLNEKNTYAVSITAVSKGSNKITENIWRSAKIEHSAGTALNCLVFSIEGEVLFADQRISYTPYQTPDAIARK